MTTLSANIPLFIAFRVLFNARFYYPVLGVLFLDLGLTLEQYALLNVVWAAAIVTLEIPSGALADVIGRRRMVVLAASLMVVEMLIFALAPRGHGELLFALLAFNRLLSGAAEAAASGADEALAYDSLPAEGRAALWPRVLVSLARWQSGAFFGAMIVGAALYDAAFVNAVLGPLLPVPLTPADTVRWPVYATLVSAALALGVALALREPPALAPRPARSTTEAPIRQALRNIGRGARFVVTQRRVLLLILAALVADSFVRLFLTFLSNYLRLIELPAFTNGPLGSALALLGFVAAPLARRLVDRGNAPLNFAVTGALIAVGLFGVGLATPISGLWVLLPLGLAMSAFGFFLSHYLNAWAPSDLRATVLSFRGLALNLGYGAVGLAFAGLTAHLRAADPAASENAVFAQALPALAPAFLVAAAAVAVFALASRSRRSV